MTITRSVFPLPLNRAQVIERDSGLRDDFGNEMVPPTIRIYTFARDLHDALYLVDQPVILVGAAAAFLARAWDAPL